MIRAAALAFPLLMVLAITAAHSECLCEDELGNCFPRDTADGIEPYGYCGPPGWRAREQAREEAENPPGYVREYLHRELRREREDWERANPEEAERLQAFGRSTAAVDRAMQKGDEAAMRAVRGGASLDAAQAAYQKAYEDELARFEAAERAAETRKRAGETKNERARRESRERQRAYEKGQKAAAEAAAQARQQVLGRGGTAADAEQEYRRVLKREMDFVTGELRDGEAAEGPRR